MPPKPKFTREEITAAALRVISRSGITALTVFLHFIGVFCNSPENGCIWKKSPL